MIHKQQIKSQDDWLIKKFIHQIFYIDLSPKNIINEKICIQVSPRQIYENYKKIYSFFQVKRIFRRFLQKGIIEIAKKSTKNGVANFYTLNDYFYQRYLQKALKNPRNKIPNLNVQNLRNSIPNAVPVLVSNAVPVISNKVVESQEDRQSPLYIYNANTNVLSKENNVCKRTSSFSSSNSISKKSLREEREAAIWDAWKKRQLNIKQREKSLFLLAYTEDHEFSRLTNGWFIDGGQKDYQNTPQEKRYLKENVKNILRNFEEKLNKKLRNNKDQHTKIDICSQYVEISNGCYSRTYRYEKSNEMLAFNEHLKKMKTLTFEDMGVAIGW